MRRNLVSIFIITLVSITLIDGQTKNARASFGTSDALVTVGLSTAAGAVLGLSTTAFYSEPTDHMENVLFGAGFGLIVGVGISAYMMVAGDQEDEIDPEELLILKDKKSLKDATKPDDKSGGESDKSKSKKDESSIRRHRSDRRLARYSALSRPSYLPTRYSSVPAVFSTQKTFALKVLELRF